MLCYAKSDRSGVTNTLKKQSTCTIPCCSGEQTDTHELENYNTDSKYSTQNVNKSLKLSKSSHIQLGERNVKNICIC